MDKGVWADPILKTRSIAPKGCELPPITSNGQPAKVAREVKPGDMLHIKTAGGEFTVEVLQVSEMRGPAALAQTLYKETEASRELRQKAAEERKTMPHFEGMRQGRPSKHDRRQIHRFRGGD